MALQGNARRLKKLVVKEGLTETKYQAIARNLALKRGIPISSASVSLLDKLSTHGNHNGLALLGSKINGVLISEAMVDDEDGLISFRHQTECVKRLPYSKHKHPLLVVLERVEDPQNLGAIIRTCYFLGVDALVVTERGSSPLSSSVSKASAGALEVFSERIFTIKSLVGFIKKAKEGAWQIFTTPLNSRNDQTFLINQESAGVPLLLAPTILVLGGEGKGLRGSLADEADLELEIDGGRTLEDNEYTVDSLNVSVAAAILIARILH